MTWRPMSEEQLSEFESLESASSREVAGVYRNDRQSWFIIATMLGLAGALKLTTVLTSAPELSFGYVLDVLLLALCIGSVAASLWFIRKDQRYGLLEDGLASVSRATSSLVPWEEITETEPVGLQFGPNGRLKVSLDSGETFKIAAPGYLLEQVARRIRMRDSDRPA